jgi:branched-chain amino acid transport system permease protein
MMGAYLTLGLFAALGFPFPVTFILVAAGGFLIGVLIDLIGFRPMRNAPQVTGFITSLAISILIQNLGIMGLSAQPRNFQVPDYLQARLEIGFLSLRVLDVAILVASILIMFALVAFVRRSRLGVAMRATADNLPVARLMGINTDRTIMLAFSIGGSLAAVAGLFWGAKYGQIDPMMGFVPGLKAFLAAVIGGVGSIAGAVVGGYLLGFAEILFVGFLPPEYASYRDGFVFTLLIVFLLVRPRGLLGTLTEERA